MTFKFVESFDLVGDTPDLNLRGWVSDPNNYWTIGATTGKFGGQGCAVVAESTGLLYPLPFVKYTTLSFYCKKTSTGGKWIAGVTDADAYIFVPSSVYSHMALATDDNGVLTLYGDLIPHQSTAPGVLVFGVWQHYEIQVEHSATGRGRVYVDDALVLDFTGDFQDDANFSSVAIYGPHCTFDDIVIQQSDVAQPPILGKHRLHTILPNADTAQADWTGTYADVDDPIGSSDGDTTYIDTLAVGNKSEFDLESLTESPTTIFAVQSSTDVRKTDVGTVGVTPYVNSNGAIGSGSEFPVLETYTVKPDVYELNPDGSVAWTTTSVNALKVGIEITT